jgi:hypothetical protein
VTVRETETGGSEQHVLYGSTLAHYRRRGPQQAIRATKQAEERPESKPRWYGLAAAMRPATTSTAVTHVQPTVPRLVGSAYAALVAKTPHYHARAVLISLVHSRYTAEEGGLPLRSVGEVAHGLAQYLGRWRGGGAGGG